MPTKKMRRGLRRSKKLRGGMFSSFKKAIGISEKPTDCDGSKSCHDLRLYEKFLTEDHGFNNHKEFYITLNKSLTKLGLYRLLENVIKGEALVGTEIIRFKSFLKCVLILMIDSYNFKYESEFNLKLDLTVDKINSVDGIIKNSVFNPPIEVCKYVKYFLEVFFKFFTPEVLDLNPKTGKDLEEKLAFKTEPANQPIQTTQTLALKNEPANQAIQALALRVDELTQRVEAMENKAGNTNPNKNSKQIGNDAMPKIE
jgi:hypothetical protein